MSFQVTLPYSDLRSLVKCLIPIVEETVFKFQEDGLYICDWESSHTSMIKATIAKEHFIEYEEGDITIDVSDLRTGEDIFFKAAEDTDVKIITTNYSVKFTVIDDLGKRTYEIPQIEKIGDVAISLPKLDLNVELKLPADVLKSLIKDAANVYSSQYNRAIKIVGEPNVITFSASAHGSFLAEITPEEYLCPKETISSYNIDWIEGIVKLPTDEFELKFASDQCIQISCEVGNIEATYLIAPRVERE